MKNVNWKYKNDIWEKYFPLIITGIFFILSLILIINHEFTFDETHAWLFASRTSSLSELIGVIGRTEGTPYLWHFVLYFISHFVTSNIESMKVIHLTISTISVFLILKYFPLNRIYRTVLVFGYYFFFEYSIISRNYAFGVLFLVIFCILYRKRQKNLIYLGITLFFLGQANYYSFIISLVLAIALIIDFVLEYRDKKKKTYFLNLIITLLIIFAEIISVYWQLRKQIPANLPSPGTSLRLIDFISNSRSSIINVLNGIVVAFIPISKLGRNFFNHSFMSVFSFSSKIRYMFPISLTLSIIPIFLIRRKYIFSYILGFLGIIAMPLFIHTGYFRHYGHILLLFISLLWISNINDKGYYLIENKKDFIKILTNSFLIIILLSSLLGSATAFYFDMKYPFSNAKNVSNFFKNNFNIEKIAIAGHWDWSAATVSAYLGKKIYCPQEKREIEFIPWSSPERQRIMSDDEIFSDVLGLYNENENIFLVLNHEVDPEVVKYYSFEEIINFENSITGVEDYYIYRFNDKLIQEIYNSNKSNFNNFWTPLNNCIFIREENGMLIKAQGNDPYFESVFSMDFKEDELVILKITMDSEIESFLQIYYKFLNKNYSENSSNKFLVNEGENIILAIIPDPENIEKIRIDPVMTNNNCLIKEIKILKK